MDGGWFDAMVADAEAKAEWEQDDFALGGEFDPSQPAWSSANLTARIDYTDEAAGTDYLKELMVALSKAPVDEKSAPPEELVELATMRGLSTQQVHEQWARFAAAKRQQQRVGKQIGDEVPALDMDEHGDHMGSLSQLRFGSYIGQEMDMDPILGALLSPTGGLVGPGNESYAAPEGSVDGFHGEAHDAFGYLGRYHGLGPGYTYADKAVAPENVEDFSHRPYAPYAGQASGYEFFHGALAAKGRPNPNSVDRLMQVSAQRLGQLQGWSGANPALPIAGGSDTAEKAVIMRHALDMDEKRSNEALRQMFE